MICSKEVVVDKMVCRMNRCTSRLHPIQGADAARDESQWITKKFKAVSAALSLEGKGEFPVSVDSLLQARPLIVRSISCLMGISLIMSQFEELDLGDDFSTDEACECLLKLAHAIQAKFCGEVVGSERSRVRNLRKQPETDYKVSSHRGIMYKAEVAMTLEERREVLDHATRKQYEIEERAVTLTTPSSALRVTSKKSRSISIFFTSNQSVRHWKPYNSIVQEPTCQQENSRQCSVR